MSKSINLSVLLFLTLLLHGNTVWGVEWTLNLKSEEKVSEFSISKIKKEYVLSSKLNFNNRIKTKKTKLSSKDYKFILNKISKIKKYKPTKKCSMGTVTLFKRKSLKSSGCFRGANENEKKLQDLANTMLIATAKERDSVKKEKSKK